MTEGCRRLAGRYELQEVIGRGGMGTVYGARDLVLDRSVAVKVLPAALAEDDCGRVARFEREARAAASLSHDGVVSVYDTGADDATRFIVMERIEGRSLAEILREEAPLVTARAAGIAAGVAGALAAAHGAGIVHRDIKPGNVMVAQDGRVKVLDFGIARALDQTALTRATTVLGTAAYVAPEQALGRPADGRCDIYALGCLLYAMLTGRPPFTGEAPAAILHQQVNSRPRPPSQLNASIPATLEALLLQMLAKDPEARPQRADTLGGQLLGAASAPANAATRQLRPAPAREQPRRSRRRRPRALAAAALAGGLLAILLVTLASSGERRPPAARGAASQRPRAKRNLPTPRPAAVSSAATASATPAAAPQASATPPPPPPPAHAKHEHGRAGAPGKGKHHGHHDARGSAGGGASGDGGD